MSEKLLMKGNEAIAEAAIRSGCKLFFGYPITPQTELSEYMAKNMPKRGGLSLQAESEIAAINMVLGASASGARAITSSSSPGISLKCEGISYIAGSDLPCVIVNVQRGGPGLGGIQPAQSDYNQATKAPGHGDSPRSRRPSHDRPRARFRSGNGFPHRTCLRPCGYIQNARNDSCRRRTRSDDGTRRL
ncbi:pyruvate flavodoxin/ferredoxin oxidoreductase thiamine diP-binding domain protein [Ruminococcus sp. CAG:382]|nr:pyruvate flavodoxin/ferredoxin oxidoreductase thiamine diP-binding domain protein [Ruminococcus sp. CAG:382]